MKVSKRAKLNLPRKIAIFISRRYGQYAHREVADYFGGISSKSISTLIQRIEKSVLGSEELQDHFERITKIIFGSNV